MVGNLSTQIARESAIPVHHLPIPLIQAPTGLLSAVLDALDDMQSGTGDTEHGNHDSIGNQGFEGDGHGSG